MDARVLILIFDLITPELIIGAQSDGLHLAGIQPEEMTAFFTRSYVRSWRYWRNLFEVRLDTAGRWRGAQAAISPRRQ
jgi:hypothetical protein